MATEAGERTHTPAYDTAPSRFAGIAAWLRDAPLPPDSIQSCDDEWRAFAGQVCRHGLAGLVLAHGESRETAIPSWVRAILRDSSARVAAENLYRMHELERVLLAFNENDLLVMLLKGAALQLTVYPDADLRPMSDVDLLVQPCDARRALKLLDDLGCRRGTSLIRDDFFPKYHYEVEVIVPSVRPMRIDLHARPLRPLRLTRIIPDNAIWNGACEVRLGTATALIPRPEYNFIHLAAHAAYHGCSRLIWLYDIKRVVEVFGDKMDWDLVVARCREWRLSLAVRNALAQAAATFGPVCPAAILEELSRHHASWCDRLALYHAPRDGGSPIGHVVCNLFCTPGLGFRLGYLTALLLPSRDHLAGLYKRRHSGWLHCAHVWRIARGFGRAFSVPFVRPGPSPAR